MRRWFLLLACVVMLVSATGCTIVVPNDLPADTSTDSGTSVPQTGTVKKTAVPATSYKWGVQTKTSGCKASGGVQDHGCTPGDIFPDATKAMICVPGYSKSVRNVPESLKNAVYASYGIKSRTAGEYEVDHLVSLELGGSNDISNLWPELAAPKPGFREKDKVENFLHDQVCSGEMTLKEAQIMIATDWHKAFALMTK